MSTKRKLELIIEMLENREVGIAFAMVKEWGSPLMRDYDPVITPFLDNKYWLSYEPTLADLREALAKVS